MSKEKAKEFVAYLQKNHEVANKMKGFSQEDLVNVINEMKTEGKAGGKDLYPRLGF
jgi:ATP-dependent Zn protease